jgi:hypothetical protein
MHEKRSLELEQLLGLPERWSSRRLQRRGGEKGVARELEAVRTLGEMEPGRKGYDIFRM